MIGCLQTRVCKQPIIAFYYEFENILKFYNLEALCAVLARKMDFSRALGNAELRVLVCTFFPWDA